MPLDPRTTAWLDQEDAHLTPTIRQHRWAVQYVGSGEEDDQPSFGYTFGSFGLGHPELVLVGLGADATHGLLQRTAEEIAAGRDLVPGELITWDEWVGRLCVEVSPDPGEVVLGANRFSSGRPSTRCRRSSRPGAPPTGTSRGRTATRAGRGASRVPARGGRERRPASRAPRRWVLAQPRPRSRRSLATCPVALTL